MQDRLAMGDCAGALEIAERILARRPDDELAMAHAETCRSALMDLCLERLGSLDAVPHVALPPDRLRQLGLDHRSGFLLSLVDSRSRIEDILDMSGMPRLLALRILLTLVEQHVISLG